MRPRLLVSGRYVVRRGLARAAVALAGVTYTLPASLAPAWRYPARAKETFPAFHNGGASYSLSLL